MVFCRIACTLFRLMVLSTPCSLVSRRVSQRRPRRQLGILQWRMLSTRSLFVALSVGWLAVLVGGIAIRHEVLTVAPIMAYGLAIVAFTGIWGGRDERALRAWLAGSLVSPRAGLVVSFIGRIVPLVAVVAINATVLSLSGVEAETEGAGPHWALISFALLLQVAALCSFLSMLVPDSYNAVVALLLFVGTIAQVSAIMSAASDFVRPALAMVNPLLWVVPERTWTSFWGPLGAAAVLLITALLLAPRQGVPVSRRLEDAVLEVRDLRKSFRPLRGRRVEALRGASFAVAKGRIVGLLGRNGAGKTTALRAILGQIRGSSGEVRWDPTARQSARFFPEDNPLAAGLKPRHYLPLFTGRDERERIEAWARMLHVADLLDTPTGRLSAGQQRRCGLLLAVAGAACVYLLDEPASGVDPIELEAMKALLAELRAAGSTVLVSTHLLREFDDALDEVVLLDEGKVLVSGPASGLKESIAVLDVDREAMPRVEGFAESVISGTRMMVSAGRREDAAATLGAQGIGFREVPTNLHDVFVWEISRRARAGTASGAATEAGVGA